MDIILIRHGESEDNISKIFSRDATKLSSEGIKQIKATRKILEGLDYKQVYYSPLTRTKDTLYYLGLQGIEEPRIREVNFGIFTGKTFAECSAEFPKEVQMWIDHTNSYEIPKGESLETVCKRVVEFLEEVVKQNENVVLITHEGIIRIACAWVMDDINYFFKFKAENGSISVISIEDGYKYISKLNQTYI
ncbi:MAG: histidine phosphatase family protein [Epulopiscium sp.]|nr:histidine phosphatase family protein [Candidatus Epulonipiscium sp.]